MNGGRYLAIDFMNKSSRIYDALTTEITSAGFYVKPPHEDEPFRRVVPATKYLPGRGYSGNSFWIACIGEQWFLGTWGGMLYLMPVSDNVGRFTIELFNHDPIGQASDFESWIVEKYRLQPFDNEDFARLIGS